MNELNAADYATVPGGPDAPGTIALGRKLLSAAPVGLTDYARASCDALRGALQLLEAAYRSTLTSEPAGPRRPVDRAADNSWACVKSRLEPWTWLPDGADAQLETAQALHRGLFPGGSLAFTQLEYDKQWSEADLRIGFLKQPGNEAKLRQLVGDVFVDELLQCHARYTEMVGIAVAESQMSGRGRGRAAGRGNEQAASLPASHVHGDALRLAEQRRLAHQAIVAWQLTLVSLHLAGHPGARAALLPTDELRERLVSPAAANRPEPPAPAPVPQPSPPAP